MMRYYRLTSFLVSSSARLRRLYNHHFITLDRNSQGQWFCFLSQVFLAFFIYSISLFYSIKLLSRLFSILSIFLSIFFYRLILLTCFWLHQQNYSKFCIGVELSIYLSYLGICSFGYKNSWVFINLYESLLIIPSKNIEIRFFYLYISHNRHIKKHDSKLSLDHFKDFVMFSITTSKYPISLLGIGTCFYLIN